MISIFIREMRRYSFDELQTLLNGSHYNTREILKSLKLKGIVKNVRRDPEEADLSELTDEEEIYYDVPEKIFYVFKYVGIIAVKDVILKCYPKYLKKTTNYAPLLKQVLRVIEKYDSRSQKINLYADFGEKTTFNRIAVMIFLLRDYYDYGLYSDSREVIEENGRGEILWDKTINNTYAVLNDDEPCYPYLYTRHHILDEQNFFRRLHACVLSRISREMEEAGLLELFDITEIPQAEEELEDLGDEDYLIYRLEQELDVQFNTRKQVLLRTISSYIANKQIATDDYESICLFGTTSFHSVWENICNAVFEDQRATPMGALQLPGNLSQNYDGSKSLESVIAHPIWHGKKDDGTYFAKKAKTLNPDFLAVRKIDGEYKFIILDAKYYTPQLAENKKLTGQPELESITKQYLYELAYRDFIESNGIKSVVNCFLFPTEEDFVRDGGYVGFSIFARTKLQNIAIRFLPAKKVFDDYLAGRKIDIEILNL